MTKTIANKCIKVLLENIHSVDDMLKAIDLIERLSKYTEEAKTDTKSKPVTIKNEPSKNEAPITAEPITAAPAIIADKAEANNEEDEEETGGLFDDDNDDDYTISVTPLVTSEPITVEPITAAPVVRRIPSENKPDNELRDLREKEIASFMPPLPEVPEEQRMSLEPPAKREAPADEKIEKLMEEGHKVMSEPAWQTFEASYRRGYDYEHLRNMWAYFHKTQPADWGELPKEAA